MRTCTEEQFLKSVAEHQMTVLRDDGLNRHVRFRRPVTISMGFDLITWPGRLCIDGDMGTYVFSRIEDMFEFFRTDRKQTNHGQMVFINLGYWAEKVLAMDKNGQIKEYVEEVARKRLIEALKEHGGTKEERRDIYDGVVRMFDEGEQAAHAALSDHFEDSWEWDLTDYTYHYVWTCYAIAWGIQQYDKSREESTVAVST